MFGRAGWLAPPLKHVTTGIFCSILKHIDLTRLGTDSGAADFGGLGLPKGAKLLIILDLRSKKA